MYLTLIYCQSFSFLMNTVYQNSQVLIQLPRHMKTDLKGMFLINDCFTTTSGNAFAICVFIFHKTEVQMVILRCLTGLNSNWFKSYDTKHKYFHFRLFLFCTKTHICIFCVFAFCVITFVPTKI